MGGFLLSSFLSSCSMATFALAGAVVLSKRKERNLHSAGRKHLPMDHHPTLRSCLSDRHIDKPRVRSRFERRGSLPSSLSATHTHFHKLTTSILKAPFFSLLFLHRPLLPLSFRGRGSSSPLPPSPPRCKSFRRRWRSTPLSTPRTSCPAFGCSMPSPQTAPPLDSPATSSPSPSEEGGGRGGDSSTVTAGAAGGGGGSATGGGGGAVVGGDVAAAASPAEYKW